RAFDARLAQPRITRQANEPAIERLLQILRRIAVALQHLDDTLKLARPRLLVRPFGDGFHRGLTLALSRGECLSADSFEKLRLQHFRRQFLYERFDFALRACEFRIK